MSDLSGFEPHRRAVEVFLKQKQENHTFPVLKPCREDDHGILPLPQSSSGAAKNLRVVALTPAAGAASRYVGIFSALAEAAARKDRAGVQREISAIKPILAMMPQKFAKLVVKDPSIYTDDDFLELADIAQYPKALFPCVEEGTTYLELKILENEIYPWIKAHAFVVPPGRIEFFKQTIAQLKPSKPVYYFEQSGPLSTLRWSTDLQPVFNSHNELAKVPAGHGALKSLFPALRDSINDADTLFIRNIDNTYGVGSHISEAVEKFFDLYGKLIENVSTIRTALHANDHNAAELQAQKLLQNLNISCQPNSALLTLQQRVFHTPESLLKSPNWQDLFARPLQLMAQVPRLDKDIGGTPVFAEIDGEAVKLCCEFPHFSGKDVETIISRRDLATHFNPVFVASELKKDDQFTPKDHPFWLIAKKTFEGKTVFYYESLLYEILGNSLYNNLVFVDLPRFLFVPHKSIDDVKGRKLKDLGINSDQG